jgi:pimeloyl-ACP methyl ester carboxylesterase
MGNQLATARGDPMTKVRSSDGTEIAFGQVGEGPPIILVGGATDYRAINPTAQELVALLAPQFAVITYDRRGRGESGDTPPYAVEREVEDLAGLVAEAGGSAFLLGFSSGAVLALDAAASGLDIPRLAVYEPPFVVDDSRPPVPDDFVAQLDRLVSEGRRDGAAEYFLTKAAGVPAEFVAPMRDDPSWSVIEGVAHTLAYDGRIMGDTMSGKPLPARRWASVTMPTLVIDGGASEAFMHSGADALAELLPNAERRTLPGQTHAVSADALMPVVEEFLAVSAGAPR